MLSGVSKFFIDRPIAANVVSYVIVAMGLAFFSRLPIAQYPEITPPTVSVTCVYPGANSRVVADTVAAPIEQQINGVENMLYMSSTSSDDGTYSLNVTFKLGTNLDMAQVLVQNRVALATPTLPDAVKQIGVSVKKASPSILLVVNLYSPDRTYDQLYLSNYATIQVRDQLARVEGVGDVKLFGQQDYSMRLWLNPEELASRGLSAPNVIQVLREQNVQVAAGRVGQPPVPTGQAFQYTVNTQGRLIEAEEFGNIILKTGEDGEVIRVHDVARVELGAKSRDQLSSLNGQPSTGLAIYQLPGSNALETAERIKSAMEDLKKSFPKGVDYAIVYDTTPFIEESVHEVYNTLRDAIILVTIVVLLFLQDWRAVVLPMIDVPVSLVGTFAIMAAFGFTLNNLTLFGLVLAIGIVVDDAIVVLENIERWMEKGLPAREAAIKAMEEISGPILAITLVLSAVFLPCVFITGITGQFFQQFALTIAASTIISAINALSMTPARAVLLFKHRKPGHHQEGDREAMPRLAYMLLFGWLGILGVERFGREWTEMAGWQGWLIWAGLWLPGGALGWFVASPLNRMLGVVFRLFNVGFNAITAVYGRMVSGLLRTSLIVLVVYFGLLGLTGYSMVKAPQGFIPTQDKGYLLVDVQLPDSASLERTQAVATRLERILLGDERTRKDGSKYYNGPPRKQDDGTYPGVEGVAHVVSIPGLSVLTSSNSSNSATMFVVLDDFHDRHSAELYSETLANRLRGMFFKEIQDARVSVFGAPAVDGLGSAGGFKLIVQDRGDNGLSILEGETQRFVQEANQQPGIAGAVSTFRSNTPQLYLDIDRTKCKSMGVALDDVFTTLSVYLGGYYVNDFNRFGRTWQVNLQADSEFRKDPAYIKQLKVRNNQGEMVPLGAIAEVRRIGGAPVVQRYNLYPATSVNGASLPGVSSGQVIDTMKQVGETTLPPSMATEWTELTLLQILAGNTALFAFGGAVVLVFLILSFMYESHNMPLAVLLVVPMCLLCSIVGVLLVKSDVNIFVQIGFIVLVGLASKNAILIVEFARDLQHQGRTPREAALEASKLRLRPIIMTSFAFILGVVPLMISEGAGAEMRRTLGVAVFSGMLGVTFFGIFLTPVFYVLLAPRTKGPTAVVAEPAQPAQSASPVQDGQPIASPAHDPSPAS